ncbi:uncharacterized protein F5891DRAFT_1190876 [Suillus fuscotomentosus]|uniref:SMODS and SLOG-associating 2TM effector domain-containing protein n=1 Tax=Suillus fuscotomentosus TaxID=1912939 RepID=A0AAD4E2N6_9AGAM|nr:uncharacterized protein F5891DRAFT_1190876 [Suillus fuscotomentosus]KAG1898492.1 hypothetical protein F5891DRAFT_1190876 [Suillus fuscotomentosus]
MDPEQNLPKLPFTPIEHSTQPQVQQQQPSQSSLGFEDNGDRPQTRSSADEKHLLGNVSSERHSPARGRNDPYADFEPVPQAPPPTRSRDGHVMRGLSRRTISGQAPISASGLGWIVPVEEKPHRRTIEERLRPTIRNAESERERYAIKAKMTGWALNVAIGLQVLLGALTTGLSAALSGKQISVVVSVLGGMSTIVASYLARARGSNEPELSIARVKDLDQFLRVCLAFEMDHGHQYGTPENGLNHQLEYLRRRFEELLGNADGQRKLSSPGPIAPNVSTLKQQLSPPV